MSVKFYYTASHYDTKNILEAQKYEEVCRDIFSKKEMEIIHDYILSMNHFFNLVRTLMIASNETKSLIDYKQNLKGKIHAEQCKLFGVEKTVPFDIFYSNCIKKIKDDWKDVNEVLK